MKANFELPEPVSRMGASPTAADVQKLFAEANQLRAQQFSIGTLAVTGSGLSAWLLPGLSAIVEKGIKPGLLVGATVFWLLLLGILFRWSLELRRVISVISWYLDLTGSSVWEGAFRGFRTTHRKLYWSQSNFIFCVFSFYGVLAVVSGLIASISGPDSAKLSLGGYASLAAFLLLYISVISWLQWLSRNSEYPVEKAWRKQLGLPSGPDDMNSPAPKPFLEYLRNLIG